MRVLSILAVVSLVACGGGGDAIAPDPNAGAVGNYSLTQLNGSTVPVTIFANSAGRIDILSGTLSLRSDHSFTETRNYQTVYNTGAPTQNSSAIDNGTFSVTGSQVTFSIPASGSSPAFSYTGAASGNVVTYTYDGDSYRYQK